MVLFKMNNHEHRTKQTYESYTFQPLMSFWYKSLTTLKCSQALIEWNRSRVANTQRWLAGEVLPFPTRRFALWMPVAPVTILPHVTYMDIFSHASPWLHTFVFSSHKLSWLSVYTVNKHRSKRQILTRICLQTTTLAVVKCQYTLIL